MIKLNITGIDEATRKLNLMSTEIIRGALYGIEESIILLEDRVRERAIQEGREDYADSIVSRMNWAQQYGIVGPSLSYAPLEEMGTIAKFIHERCPWWKYLEDRLRPRVPSFPLLREVLTNNRDIIENTIIRNIRELIR